MTFDPCTSSTLAAPKEAMAYGCMQQHWYYWYMHGKRRCRDGVKRKLAVEGSAVWFASMLKLFEIPGKAVPSGL